MINVTLGNSPTFSWTGPNSFTSNSDTINLNNITTNQFGKYVVNISSAGTCGSIDLTYTITGENPITPIANNVSICANTSTTLTANGSNGYKWYNTPTGGTYIATGSNYTTPTLNTDTTYYVSGITFPIVTESITTADINEALDYTGNQTMYFDAHDSFVLNSVKVYALSDGDRTITITDAYGNTVASQTVNILTGESIIPLNMNISKGLNHQIAITSTLKSLRRSNSGITYPYTSPSGAVSITNSSAGGNYYYYFYDWNITTSGGKCESVRTPVNVRVETNPSLNNACQSNINNTGFVNFNNGSTITLEEGQTLALKLPSTLFNGTWLWTAPNGTNYSTETVSFPAVIDNDTNVEGAWSLLATYTLDCARLTPQTINFNVVVNPPLSTVSFNQFDQIKTYPNPTKNYIIIESLESLLDSKLTVYDLRGRKINTEKTYLKNNTLQVNLTSIESGTYFIHLTNGLKKSILKIVKE